VNQPVESSTSAWLRYELWVGLRYLVSVRDARRPSIITLISVGAVAVGVMALIVVLAVHGGFEGDLRSKILASKSHMLVSGEHMGPIAEVTPLLAMLDARPELEGLSPFIETELLLSSPTNYSGVVLRGIDPERVGSATTLPETVRDGQFEWLNDPDAAISEESEQLERELTELRDRIERLQRDIAAELPEAQAGSAATDASGTIGAEGSSPNRVVAEGSATVAATPTEEVPLRRRMRPLPGVGTTTEQWRQENGAGADEPPAPQTIPGILIGTELAEGLGVTVGEIIDLVSPDGPLGPTGPTPMVRRYRVTGIFYSGLYEYDQRMAYVLMDEARLLLGMGPDEVSGVEVRLADMDAVDLIRPALQDALNGAGYDGLEVHDWKQLNESLFSALMLEKVVIGLLVMIIELVACFAIICVLIMVVLQKGAEIAILRSMGCTRGGIVMIFVTQGTAIGLLGTLVGLALGLALVGYATWVGIPLDPEVYYIDQVPLEIGVMDVVAIVVGAIASAVLATLYPSVQAAGLEPAAGLRYE
jgi:lipoprotein-releasing system permease protein